MNSEPPKISFFCCDHNKTTNTSNWTASQNTHGSEKVEVSNIRTNLKIASFGLRMQHRAFTRWGIGPSHCLDELHVFYIQWGVEVCTLRAKLSGMSPKASTHSFRLPRTKWTPSAARVTFYVPCPKNHNRVNTTACWICGGPVWSWATAITGDKEEDSAQRTHCVSLHNTAQWRIQSSWKRYEIIEEVLTEFGTW